MVPLPPTPLPLTRARRCCCCRLAHLCLTSYYYWVNMGPLTRGSAAVGLAVLVGSSLACNLPVSRSHALFALRCFTVLCSSPRRPMHTCMHACTRTRTTTGAVTSQLSTVLLMCVSCRFRSHRGTSWTGRASSLRRRRCSSLPPWSVPIPMPTPTPAPAPTPAPVHVPTPCAERGVLVGVPVLRRCILCADASPLGMV